MKKANSLNEQIDRILQVSDYKIPETKRTLVEMVTPIGEVAPMPQQQPAQGQQQPNPQQTQQADAAFEREVDTALNQLIQTLPQQLQQIATTQGDRDGKLEPVGQENQQPATQQPQQAGQPTQQTQPVAESELDEALAATIAGGALAAPAIASLVGKASSYLGKKMDNQTMQQFGEKVSHIAHDLHHKYLEAIKGAIAPYITTLLPKQQETVTNGVFYALVAALGAAGFFGATHAAHSGNVGLAAVEGGLTSVKASELFNAAKGIVPKILGNVVA